MEWVADGKRHAYESEDPDPREITSVPYSEDVRVQVTFPTCAVYAQTRFWTKDKVCVWWHDEESWYKTCWVPADWVRRVGAEEYGAYIEEQINKIRRPDQTAG